jgi:RNA polymerase sigma factor (sigma-70 family)
VALADMTQPTDGRPPPEGLDALRLLLRDLPSGPPLTAEQEQALARRIRGEDVVVPAPGKARPTVREALDRMVEQNMRLVIAVARAYRGRGAAIEDLVQEGAMALHRAAERFDPSSGNRFSTYAVWWLREAMVHALHDSRAVRLPEKLVAQITRVRRAEQSLVAELERDPTADEIGEVVGLSGRQVEELRHLAHPPISVYGTDGGDDHPPEDRLAEPGPSPASQAERRSLADAVRGAIAGLTPRQRQVLALRYGIGHPQTYSPRQVERRLGLSRDGASRIEMQALAILRSHQAARELRAYVT